MIRRRLALWCAWLLLLLLALIVACGKAEYESASGDAAMSEEVSREAGAGAVASPASTDPLAKQAEMPRKIIYTGGVSLVTEDLDKLALELEALVRRYKGYISGANRHGSRGSTRKADWTIRIPSDSFEEFVADVATLGELESSNRTAQDVSEEYYDAQARLKNKRVEEARLIDLLKNATGKLNEILTVEKELNRVREEIERIEGRLRFLSNQTSFSTVNVSVREVKDFVPEGPPTFLTEVKRTFSGSLEALQRFTTAAILLLIMIVPWLLPIGLLFWLVRSLAKRRTRRP